MPDTNKEMYEEQDEAEAQRVRTAQLKRGVRSLKDAGRAGKPVELWVQIQKYEPFTMGGSVWRSYRYRVTGDKVRLPVFGGTDVGIYREPNGAWCVFHLETGGRMSHGRTYKAALKKAMDDLKSTPSDSWEIQVKRQPRLMGLAVMSTEEAHRLLLKKAR